MRQGALVVRPTHSLTAHARPGSTGELRVWLPAGARVVARNAAEGVGPFVSDGEARAVFLLPGGRGVQQVVVEGGRVVEARLERLDPTVPHTLHARPAGLGALDGSGAWRWQPTGEVGERLAMEVVEGVLPPGDRVAQFAREAVDDAGATVDAVVLEDDGRWTTRGWSRAAGRRAPGVVDGELLLPEKRRGWAFSVHGVADRNLLPPEERSGWAFSVHGLPRVAWSPDGRMLAVADERGVLVCRWTGAALVPWRRLPGSGATCITWGGAGWIATGHMDATVRVWDPLATRPLRATLEGHTSRVESVSWGPGGLLASGSNDSTVRVWDPLAAQTHRATLKGHTRPVTSVSWGPGGLLASGSYDTTVRVWHPLAPRPHRATMEGHTNGVKAVSWGPGGILASAAAKTVRVWDPLATQPYRATIEGHRDDVRALSWSPSAFLASGSGDRTVRVWDPLAARPHLATLGGHSTRVESVSWTHDGLLAAGSWDGTVQVWAPFATRPIRARLKGHPTAPVAVSWGPGALLAAGVDNFSVWVCDPLAPRPHRATLEGHASPVRSVSWGPGGLLASGSFDKTVRVWEPLATSQHRVTLSPHQDSVLSASWCPGGPLATGSVDKTVRVWEPLATQTHRVTLEGHSKSVQCVSWSPESLLASGADDRTVRVWDPLATQPHRAMLTGHMDGVQSVTWGPGGLLASGSWDRTVRVWDPLADRPHRAMLEGHTRAVAAVSWGSGGLLASGSFDMTVRVWDPLADRPLRATLTGHTREVLSVSWGPGGLLASGGPDGIRLWNIWGAEPRSWSGHQLALHRDETGVLHLHRTEGGPWRVPYLLPGVDWVIVGPHIDLPVAPVEPRCPEARLAQPDDGPRCAVSEGALHLFDHGPPDAATPWRMSVFPGAAPTAWRPSPDPAWPSTSTSADFADVAVRLAPVDAAVGAPVVAFPPDGLPIAPDDTRLHAGPDGSLRLVARGAALRLGVEGWKGPVDTVALGEFVPGLPRLLTLHGPEHPPLTVALPRFDAPGRTPPGPDARRRIAGPVGTGGARPGV